MAKSKSFTDEFKKNMNSMGLPVPNTLFKTVAITLGTTGALVGAIAKVGASATVAEIFFTGSAAAGGTALAAAASEVIVVIGALAASFYIGACIGSVLVAAYETLGISEIISNIQPWLRKISESLGETAHDLLKRVFAQFPTLAPVRKAMLLGASL